MFRSKWFSFSFLVGCVTGMFICGFFHTIFYVLSRTELNDCTSEHAESVRLFSETKEQSGLFEPPDFIFNKIHPDKTYPSVLCMVTTIPKHYKSKVIHIAATWGRRCNHVVYLSSKDCGSLDQCRSSWNKLDVNQILEKDGLTGEPTVEILEVAGHPGRKQLWEREKIGFKMIWEKYNKFDFFLKTDDDSYIVVENLKHALQHFSPENAMLLGHYQTSQGIEYMSGGPGYVVSRKGLRDVVENIEDKCDLPVQSEQQTKLEADEDLQMGACAKLLDFKIVPSNTMSGEVTFIPYKLQHLLLPQLEDGDAKWFHQHSLECSGMFTEDCLDQYPVSIHYSSAVDMYKLEYLLYKVKVQGEYK